jgi:hypothetical protein
MRPVHYRLADESDVPAMARIPAAEWETEEYWRDRISRYMNSELHPQQALMPRVSYVALEGETLEGFIAMVNWSGSTLFRSTEGARWVRNCFAFWPHGLLSKKRRGSVLMLTRPTQLLDASISDTALTI